METAEHLDGKMVGLPGPPLLFLGEVGHSSSPRDHGDDPTIGTGDRSYVRGYQ
jgi:hypothetical protein